jgi:hypothetical protein
MKLMTCEFSAPDDVVWPSIERRLLMGRRRPPDNMSIRIGHYKGSGYGNVYLRNASTMGVAPVGVIPDAPPGGSFARNVQAQQFFIGELFVQAISTTLDGLKFRPPHAFAHTCGHFGLITLILCGCLTRRFMIFTPTFL